MLAATFLFSCTEVERDNPYDSGGINYIGDNDIDNYRTVQIGDQVWMAENLKYEVRGSECSERKYERYIDAYGVTSYHKEYECYYSWATAMKLPAICDSISCESQISAKHRGICPEGWHIPSNADWDKLLRYVDGTSGTESPYESETAGKDLKSTRGWVDEDYNYGNGTDKYDFSALPALGGGSFVGNLYYYGPPYASWWSSSVDYVEYAYSREISLNDKIVSYDSQNKNSRLSIRCLQD